MFTVTSRPVHEEARIPAVPSARAIRVVQPGNEEPSVAIACDELQRSAQESRSYNEAALTERIDAAAKATVTLLKRYVEPNTAYRAINGLFDMAAERSMQREMIQAADVTRMRETVVTQVAAALREQQTAQRKHRRNYLAQKYVAAPSLTACGMLGTAAAGVLWHSWDVTLHENLSTVSIADHNAWQRTSLSLALFSSCSAVACYGAAFGFVRASCEAAALAEEAATKAATLHRVGDALRYPPSPV